MEIRISLKVLNPKNNNIPTAPNFIPKTFLIFLMHLDYIVICVLQMTRIHNRFL
jgi:hypothetical protein